jgi:hypothetical protein
MGRTHLLRTRGSFSLLLALCGHRARLPLGASALSLPSGPPWSFIWPRCKVDGVLNQQLSVWLSCGCVERFSFRTQFVKTHAVVERHLRSSIGQSFNGPVGGNVTYLTCS